jgi:hypothetical protein
MEKFDITWSLTSMPTRDSYPMLIVQLTNGIDDPTHRNRVNDLGRMLVDEFGGMGRELKNMQGAWRYEKRDARPYHFAEIVAFLLAEVSPSPKLHLS